MLAGTAQQRRRALRGAHRRRRQGVLYRDRPRRDHGRWEGADDVGGTRGRTGTRRPVRGVDAVALRRSRREHRPEDERPVEAGHRRGERHGLRRGVLHARRGRLHHRRRARDVLRSARLLRHDRVLRVDAHAAEDAVPRDHAGRAARRERAHVGTTAPFRSGLVSEVVAADELHDAAAWAANEIASSPPIAIQGTVRAIWMARELSRMQALDAGRVLIRLGSDPESLLAGQRAFESGERIKPRKR